MEVGQMDEMDQPQQTPGTGTGPVTIDDVQAALDDLDDTDPRHTNAAAIRRIIGRGSLSTIQKHLAALRDIREARERFDGVSATYEDVIAPLAPEGIMRGIWEAAFMAAMATVQDRLIREQEKAAELEVIRQAQVKELEDMAELVDKVEEDRDWAKSEAKAAREAQAKAEAERDDALRLRDQIAALMAKIDAITPTPAS
jgi:hypothetical protein